MYGDVRQSMWCTRQPQLRVAPSAGAADSHGVCVWEVEEGGDAGRLARPVSPQQVEARLIESLLDLPHFTLD